MIRVPRPDLEDTAWQDWWEKARTAMDALVKTYTPGENIPIDDEFYQKAKPFLLKLFNGKCAYCETVISSNQPGDVEHYRPKGRIRTKDGVVKVKIGDKEMEHPGYWWLAYHWTNLLPSCIDCNRRRRHDDDVMAGKSDYFEILGSRAVQPTDPLDAENALLLDPSSTAFDPDAHFEFKEDGTIKPLTEQASHSCTLLGLNLREKLVSQRKLVILQAKQAFVTFVREMPSTAPELLVPTRQQINDMWEGRSEYSAFARTALRACSDLVYQNTKVRIPLPLP
jgi:hypothetical protein